MVCNECNESSGRPGGPGGKSRVSRVREIRNRERVRERASTKALAGRSCQQVTWSARERHFICGCCAPPIGGAEVDNDGTRCGESVYR